MLRPILAASTLALLLATPSLAQAPATTEPTQLEQMGLTPPTTLSQGYATSGEDVLVTQLIGQSVFASNADDAEEIGTITDMVVTSGQGISAVVINVGGFLGVGEKAVAVNFSQLTWSQRTDGSRHWVLETSTDTLMQAPAFIWSDSEEVTGDPALTRQQEEDQLVEGDPNATAVDPALTTDQPNRTTITTPLDRTGFTDFDETGLTANDLIGIGVYGINDEQIGAISDLLANPDGSFDAVVVDVGGFLGIGAKPVAVAFENLAFSADTLGNRYLFINTSREQLENQPAYDAETYSSDRDAQRMVITP